MLFLTRYFGVTASDAERNAAEEQAIIEAIVERVLAMQAKAAAEQRLPLRRGTHAKGTCVKARFEVFDVTAGRDSALAARLVKGIFATPGVYPATARFGNSDAKINSDFKPDVRSLSISVDLTKDGTASSGANVERQDFSLQNATTLPINDASAFLAITKVLTASNPVAGLWSLPFNDKLRALRTLTLVQCQTHQKIKPDQQLRYWSNVPFRHGPSDVVKQSATPARGNLAHPLRRNNPNALQDELLRHVQEDDRMSSFDFGLQLLNPERMSYWGKRQDASLWIENASLEWKEAEAPFHTVARLSLLSRSPLLQDASESTYFDVTRHLQLTARPSEVLIAPANMERLPAEKHICAPTTRVKRSRRTSSAFRYDSGPIDELRINQHVNRHESSV
jgi:hypothetical protein